MKPKIALRHFLALAGCSLLAISSTHAGQIWDGTGANNNITTPENWDGDVVANFGSAISFGGNVRNAVTNDRAAASTIAGINFTNDGTAGKTNAFTLTGNSITLTGNITGATVTTGPAITNTIDLDIILNANRNMGPGGNQNITISGDISETGTGRGLIQNAGGTTTLTGTNTFTGTIAAQQGTIVINSIADFGTASSVGAGTSGSITLGSANATATLRYTGGEQTTNRTIRIHNSASSQTGGARIINDGTGALTFNATTFNDAYTNTFTVNRALTLGGTNGGSITGKIQDASLTSTHSVVKIGDGTWNLGGTNTYTGATTVQQGNLVAGSNSLSGQDGAFGNATTEINLGVAGANDNAGILIGGAYTVGRNVRLLTSNTTDAGTRVLTLGGNTAHNSEFSGNIILGTNSQAGRGITLTAANGGQVTFSGVIQNPTSMDATTYTVTKAGLGTVVLSNTNTYTGATTISAGTLLVNNTTGSGTGTNTVDVGANGTLGGTGAISGAVNVTGQLSPGVSIETLATGTLSMANSSTLVHELDSSVADAVGSDLLKVTGDLNLSGTVNLTLADLAVTDVPFAVNDVFSLINYTGIWNGGLFTFGADVLADEDIFTFGLNTWMISYDDATGGLNFPGEYAGGADSFVNITAVTVIPEPGAALLGGLGFLLLLRRRR